MSVSTLVQGLLSDDNDIRKRSETAYEQAKAHNIGKLIVSFASLIGEVSTDTDIRAAVAVLLRKLIFDMKPSEFEKVSQPDLAKAKQALVQGFRQDSNVNTIRKVSSVIATLAHSNMWSDSVKVFVAHAEKAASHEAARSFLIVLDNLCEFAGDLVVPFAGRILAVIQKGLSGSVDLKLTAIQCAASLVYSMSAASPDLVLQKKFVPVLGPVLDQVVVILKQPNNDMSETALKSLEILARQVPTNFKPILTKLCSVCSQVAAHPKLDERLRAMALEVMKSIATGAGAMVRKSNAFTKTAIMVSLRMLAEVQDDEWDGASCDPIDESEQAPWNVAADAMAVFADMIGSPVVPILFQMVPALLTNSSWKQRYAALQSIAKVVGSETCAKIIRTKLDTVVKMVNSTLFLHAHVV